jgi:hypothetical protein
VYQGLSAKLWQHFSAFQIVAHGQIAAQGNGLVAVLTLEAVVLGLIRALNINTILIQSMRVF